MWVRFLKDWDWRERPTALVAYKKDTVVNVTKRCAEEAIEKGVAEAAKAPGKNEERYGSPAKRARADGQNNTPTEADLGEAEGPAGSAAAAGTATPAGATASAT